MVTTGDLFAKKDGENYKFILPPYQRGYRWRSPSDGDISRIEDSQVLQLLDDINDYVTNDGFDGLFYCMQPVIVAPTKNKNEFYLIDGQQRLTTLFLLYRYLKHKNLNYKVWQDNRIPQEKKSEETLKQLNESIFYLKYENRDIEDWLNNIHLTETEKINSATADKYFLSSAYSCIVKWFEVKAKEDESVEEKFRVLLSREISATNVEIGKKIPRSMQFIWYELDKEEIEGQEKLFQRINKGKLPLTSAELIKAFLFGEFDRKIKNLNVELNRPEYSEVIESRKRITQSIKNAEQAKDRFEKEWEEYENAMQNDSFWYFISKHHYDTRLEYLFELILASSKNEKTELCSGQNIDSPQHTFCLFKQMYDSQFKNNGGIEKARNVFFEYYQKLRKYYNDWELYHLIGCLIHLDVSMADICCWLSGKQLISDAAKTLREKILQVLYHDNNNTAIVTDAETLKKKLSELDYEKREQMRKVLLVFNIASILRMKQKNIFFAFDKFHDGEWDLEHICSQNQTIDNNKKDQWMDTILDYFLGTAFVPPPPGTETREEAEIRRKRNTEIFDAEKEKIMKSESLFRSLLENKGGQPTWKEKDDELKNCILCGIYLVKQGMKKEDAWDKIFELVNLYERHNAPRPEVSHSLDNITLLDAQTNRSYKNSPFFVKRKHIISVEENGRFILPCTRNVFLKIYSQSIDDMLYWDPNKDGKAYFNKINDTLAEFFSLAAVSKNTEDLS